MAEEEKQQCRKENGFKGKSSHRITGIKGQTNIGDLH
jgi:hypothetical protein